MLHPAGMRCAAGGLRSPPAAAFTAQAARSRSSTGPGSPGVEGADHQQLRHLQPRHDSGGRPRDRMTRSVLLIGAQPPEMIRVQIGYARPARIQGPITDGEMEHRSSGTQIG